MATNTLSLGNANTFNSNGTILSSAINPINDQRLTNGGVYSGTIVLNRTAGGQTIASGGYVNLTLSNTSGSQTAGGTITVSGTLTTTAGGTLQINSGGTLELTGTLSSTNSHVINGEIKLNGGDFIVSGQKDKDVNYSSTAGTPPYMIINGSITDILTAGFRSNSIRFLPSNSGTNKVSHIRFVGSGLTLGNSSNSFNGSIQTNEKVYFEIGDGSTSTALTINDTLRLFNGLRTRSSSTLTTNGMLTLMSTKDNQPGAGKSIGYLDTCVLGTISGSVNLVETMSATRKFRFLGNPFSGNLSITDFTDDIDISGDRSGAANNNFTQTISNAPSAFTYNNSTDAWVAITNTAPTVLNSLHVHHHHHHHYRFRYHHRHHHHQVLS
jgi:hypothetical protein